MQSGPDSVLDWSSVDIVLQRKHGEHREVRESFEGQKCNTGNGLDAGDHKCQFPE